MIEPYIVDEYMMERANSELSERTFQFTSFTKYLSIVLILFCFLMGLFFLFTFFSSFDGHIYWAVSIVIALLLFYRSWQLFRRYKQEKYFVKVNEKGIAYFPKSKSTITIQWEENDAIDSFPDYGSTCSHR